MPPTLPVHSATSQNKPAKRNRQIDADTEERIVHARAEWMEGGWKSIKAAARHFKVSYPTLRRRCKGEALPKKQAHVKQMLLSNAEKRTLVEWIRYLGLMAMPVNKRTIRPKVLDILKSKGITVKEGAVSKSWIRKFYKQFPELKLNRGSGLDPKRAKAFNYSSVNEHFKMLKEVLEEKEIPWENVYNMDEKGIQLGGGRKGSQEKYFFDRNDKMMYRLKSDELQLVTILDTVSADGTADIKPAFVFTGVTKCPQWFEVDPEILIATSANGWTDDEIGFAWFKDVFVPQAQARNKSKKPILLIYDGHGSHTQETWANYGFENNIILYCLPPHTTHRLQPLDVGCFSPLQSAWFKRCDLILNETGEGIQLADVVKEYMAARKISFVPNTILKAWKNSGIRPLDPGIFKESDFAPSKASSTTMHVPATFPTRLPRAYDASSDDDIFGPQTHFTMESSENEDSVNEDSDNSNDSDYQSSTADLSLSSDDNDSETDSTDTHATNIEAMATLHSPRPHRHQPRPMWLDPVLAPQLDRSDNGQLTNQLHSTLSSPQPSCAMSSLPDPLSVASSMSSLPRPLSVAGSLRRTRSSTRVSQTPTAQPTSPFFCATPPSTQLLRHEISHLQQRVATLEAQLDAANVHAVFAQREASVYAYKLNKKRERKAGGRRRIHTSARILTSEQGRREAREDAERQREKRRKETEKKQKKKDRDAEDAQRRLAQTQSAAAFVGGLSQKNKAALGDIAASLGLSVDGTVKDIRGRIEEFFSVHPEQKISPRYMGLFQPRGRKRPAPSENEDHSLPPTQHRRFDDITNTFQTPIPSYYPITAPSQMPMSALSTVSSLPPHSSYHYRYNISQNYNQPSSSRVTLDSDIPHYYSNSM